MFYKAFHLYVFIKILKLKPSLPHQAAVFRLLVAGKLRNKPEAGTKQSTINRAPRLSLESVDPAFTHTPVEKELWTDQTSYKPMT